MAELAGKFAGIVVVTVPADRATDLTGALRDLDGMLEVSAHPGTDAAADQRSWPQLTLDLIGNDHAGIVHEVSAVVSRHGLSIEMITTGTRDVPMAGGMIFEAHVVAPSRRPATLPPCVPTSRSWRPNSWSTSAPTRRRGEHRTARGSRTPGFAQRSPACSATTVSASPSTGRSPTRGHLHRRRQPLTHPSRRSGAHRLSRSSGRARSRV